MSIENKGPGGVGNSYGARSTQQPTKINSLSPKGVYNEFDKGAAATFSADGKSLVGVDGEIVPFPLQVYSSFVPFDLTGTTTQTVMTQVSIPDGAMGPNSELVIEAAWQWPNSANNKTYQIYIGNGGSIATATDVYGRVRTTTRSESIILTFGNRGVKNQQVQRLSGGYTVNSSNPLSTNTFDFALSGWVVYFTGTLTNSTETLTLGGVKITITNPYN